MNTTSGPLAIGKRIEVFFDGECPLCLREIKMLRWLDRKDRIQFTDISASEFRPTDYAKSMSQFMDEIQGRTADGTWITGVEVLRQLYAAIGLQPLVWLTKLPLISHSLEIAYHWFAKRRLRLTGRCSAPSSNCNF